MNAILHPFVELRRMISGRLREVKLTPQIDEELFLDGLEACAKDVGSKVLAPIEQTTHAAETADLEALRLKALAQMPDSAGGRNITPEEAAAIFRNVSRSAQLDHDASELARHDAA